VSPRQAGEAPPIPCTRRFEVATLLAKHGTIAWMDFQVHEAGTRKGLPRGLCFVEFASRKEADTARGALQGYELHESRLQVRYVAEEWFYGSGEGEPRSSDSMRRGETAPSAGAREYKTNAERFAEANRVVARERAREAEQRRLNLARLEARSRTIEAKLRSME
jgi:hypothetical protein